jgi:hypothetical protein
MQMSMNEQRPLVLFTGRSTMATAMMMAVMLGLLTQTGCGTTRHTNHGEHRRAHQHRTTSGPANSALATPPAIVTEHEHLHHQLDAAIASGGKTGDRAREVAAALESHFEQEEAYAMPPLGLLESLAWNQPVDDATASTAINMADRLRDEYANMLHEHEVLTAALHRLASAATEENKPEHAAFAEALIMHAQHEEQVLYPATLMIGEYLKIKR